MGKEGKAAYPPQGTISKNKGEIIRFDDLGFKGFTYKIKKKSRGQYFLVYLDGPGAMVAEIERFLRIDENVIRFVVVKLDKHVTREALEPKAEAEPETTSAAEQEDVGA